MPRLLLAACLTLVASPVLAHGGGHGLADGIAHPFTGIDHLLVMLAVGLWAAGSGVARLPLAFALGMAAGFAAAFVLPAGFGPGMAEPMILASMVLLGAALALRLQAPVALSAAILALLGSGHGLAHGIAGQSALFGLGALAATLVLHLAGYQLARRLLPMAQGALALRASGGAMALGAVLVAYS